MTIFVQDILSFFGVLGLGAISVSGVVAFAYWLFKLFSDKWLSVKFSQQLEKYKHDQQKELEDVRFEFNKLMDRAVKLHQREFDVLPEALAFLVEAYGITLAVTSSLQQYADVERMNEVQLDAFLGDSPLEDWQKEELKATKEKSEYYQKAINWHKLSKARSAANEYHVYRLKHGIFMLPDIQDGFEKMDNLIFNALVEYGLRMDGSLDYKERDAKKKLASEGTDILKKLETSIHERLWN